MTEKWQRLILKDPTSKSAVHDLAVDEHWRFTRRILANPDEAISYELVWLTSDGVTTVHYVEDDLVKFPYLVVKGEGDNLSQIADTIHRKLEVYSREEISDLVQQARTRGQKMEAIAFLGVSAPTSFDQSIFEGLVGAMSDRDPEVRRTAVWMTGYSAWPQYRELLTRLMESDTDESVRTDAGFVLAGFDAGKLLTTQDSH
jgi:hypothetical protein